VSRTAWLSDSAGLLLALLVTTATAADGPDSVYLNARVWTGDPAQPAATAFALKGDRFVAVGSDDAVRKLARAETVIVDLGGHRVVPGFIDSHWHLPSRRSARLDASGSVAVIQQRLLDYARSLPADSWVVGRGWMPNDFPGRVADKRYLDEIFPGRPVVIRDRDGHQALANSRALELAGVDRDTPDPPDGQVVRDASGAPTGLLKEAAAALVTGRLPELSAEDTYQLLLAEMATAASLGLTSLQDATDVGLTDNERMAAERAQAEGKLPVRYRASVPLDENVTAQQLAAYVAMREATRGQLLYYGFAKAILDGTVDAGTAFMLEPFVGGGNGQPMMSQTALNRTVAAYDKAGLQVALHTIGDGAIRMALDAYEHAAGANGPRERRHRLEHVEVPALADLPRMRELGVVASTQPIGATPDATTLENYAPLIGPARAARDYAPRIFDAAGVVQAFGSDYPVYTMDPIAGIHAVVTRQTRDGQPAGGWYPANRIDVETALRHYTRDAAWSSFEEDLKGTIAAGKYADFAVLSHDMLHATPQQLRDTRVLATFMGGRETFRAAGFRPDRP
jgi:predicted amidohydrolase YtcJ